MQVQGGRAQEAGAVYFIHKTEVSRAVSESRVDSAARENGKGTNGS